ncbi:MAG: hypothetical protein RIT07_885 [Bacteroidota bacterium]|jgi:hypothetical protein
MGLLINHLRKGEKVFVLTHLPISRWDGYGR